MPPEGPSAGLTLILETLADSSCLRRNESHFRLRFTTAGGLPGPGTLLHVWTSTQDALFVSQPPVTIGPDSAFTVDLPPDSMATISTVATATHGSFPDAPIPPPTPWALPYADDFRCGRRAPIFVVCPRPTPPPHPSSRV